MPNKPLTRAQIEAEPEKPKCKGLFFRVEYSHYVQGRGEYGERTRTRLFKRLSCAGCGECERLLDAFAYDIGEGTAVVFSPTPEHPNPTRRVYRLRVEVTSTDYETGYADDWQWVFEEVKPAPQAASNHSRR